MINKPIKNDDGSYSFPGEYKKQTFIDRLLRRPRKLKRISSRCIASAIALRNLVDKLDFSKHAPHA